jgi:16S rRNA (uracil1498-N3)-methyltransferase
VIVGDLEDPQLNPSDHHHLARVLRLRAGESVSVTDGHGGWRACAWRDSGLIALGEPHRFPAPHPPITVAFALTKGDRPEWVVQKLTELGVDRIVPMLTDRCVVRWDATRAVRHGERLAAAARAAAMQSRRVWLPELAPITPFADVVVHSGARAARAAPGGQAPTLDRPVVLVGPEGGWSPSEETAVPATIGLGPGILRAETAALAAAALMAALRHAVVTPRSVASNTGRGSPPERDEPARA